MPRLFYVTFDEEKLTVREPACGAVRWSDAPLVAYEPSTQIVRAIGATATRMSSQPAVVVVNAVREGGIESDVGQVLIRHALREAMQAAGVRFFRLKPDIIVHPLAMSRLDDSVREALVASARYSGARRVLVLAGLQRSDAELIELASRSW